MSKLGWLGFIVLVLNTLLAGWVAWKRYSLASELDTTTTGTIVSVQERTTRSSSDRVVASYSVGGKFYTVQGNSSEDSSISVEKYPLDSKITVYLSSKDPSVSALTPRAGFGLWAGTAALLLLVTAMISYFVFLKRS